LIWYRDHRLNVVHIPRRRQVADVLVDYAKERDDGGLVGGDAGGLESMPPPDFIPDVSK